MARYGKTVKTVEEVVYKAMTKGVASAKRNGREVYGAVVAEVYGERILSFHHYGTRTLCYNLDTNTILEFYGFSSSDRDSLNTVLDYVCHDASQYFKLVGGGIELHSFKVATA